MNKTTTNGIESLFDALETIIGLLDRHYFGLRSFQIMESNTAINEKICMRCGKTKPATLKYFHFDSDASANSDGLMNICAECRNAKRRDSYNPKKARADYVRRCLERNGKEPRKYPI